MPALYYHDPNNGSFIRVPEQPYHKIYCSFFLNPNCPQGYHCADARIPDKYGNGTNQYDTDIQEFPEEFRMIAGNALLRAENSTAMGPYGSELGWFCHGNGTSQYPDISAVGFPKGFIGCPNGLAAAITMPSCWNGEDFDVSNPSAHMAYPVADGISGCPSTHQVARFPQIFVEYWLNIDTFDGLYTANDSPFVLAMGDATGYGYHVDFINGWTPGVLNATMPTCTPGNTGVPPLSDPTCFGNRGGIYSDEEIKACMLKPTVNEDSGWTYPEQDNPDGGVLTYGGVLNALPGCQTITTGPEPAVLTTCS